MQTDVDCSNSTDILDVVHVTREDRERPGLSRDDALRNAPAVADECFRVPRMG